MTKKNAKARKWAVRDEFTPPQFNDLLFNAIENPGTLSADYHQAYDYSILNRMLIRWQCHDKGIEYGIIGTFKFWKDHGRKVTSGKGSGMAMAQPRMVPRKDKDGNVMLNDKGEPMMRVIFVYPHLWWVLSQTEGEPLPPLECGDWDVAQALAENGVEVEDYRMDDGNCAGYAYTNDDGEQFVAINPISTHHTQTLLHEVAHHVLGHTKEGRMEDGEVTPRNIKELEAEATAYIVAASLGVSEDELSDSRGYIQHWKGSEELTERIVRRIFKAANDILSAGGKSPRPQPEEG